MADITAFDLNLLRTFDALMDERSVTRAAGRLALSQPAVSAALSRLRSALGDPLFVRTQRGLLPTPRASSLAEPIKRLLNDIEAVVRPSEFYPAAAQLEVSVSASDYTQRVLLTPFLAVLQREAPGARLALRALQGARLSGLIARGDLDLALLTPEEAPPTLLSRRLFADRYVCAMRRGHPAAGGEIGLDLFCALDHALVSPDGGGFRGPVDTALEALGRTRRVAVSVPSFLGLLDVIEETDLVAAVPERLVRKVPHLIVSPLPVEVPGFTIIGAWHERTRHDPAHRWIRRRLAVFAESLDA